MQTEYEATFEKINKEQIRQRLQRAGAKLERPEYFQKRVVFDTSIDSPHTWIRVRDEGDKITMSYKEVTGDSIENQKEICLVVDNFDNAVELLTKAGCQRKAFQESKRELWTMDDADITIDTWPFLETFLEVEADSEEKVRKVCEKLELDYSQALFCAIGYLYMRKYGISSETVNKKTPLITFDMENPFEKYIK